MDRQPLLGFPLGTTLLQPTTIGRRTKTTTYAVAASDNAYEIVATTGTWTLTLPAPSAGFWIIFQNKIYSTETFATNILININRHFLYLFYNIL